MKTICLCCALLLLASTGALADRAAIAIAENAAAVGDYQLAVHSYEQVLARSGYSAPVLFNLGNAWLRSGEPARAILAYERALVLAPRNPAIESNLAAAQQRAGITATVVGPWLATARYLSLDTYAWAGLGAVWVLSGALVLLCLNGAPRRLARPLILLAAVTLCVSVDAAVLCWPDLHRAVLQEPATLRLAPAAAAAAGGTVRAGEVVWIQGRFAGFNLVRTADGHTGWVSDAAAVPVRIVRQ